MAASGNALTQPIFPVPKFYHLINYDGFPHLLLIMLNIPTFQKDCFFCKYSKGLSLKLSVKLLEDPMTFIQLISLKYSIIETYIYMTGQFGSSNKQRSKSFLGVRGRWGGS